MARRKTQEATPAREMSEILDRVLVGEPVSPVELQAAAVSAAGLRKTWLAAVADVVKAIRPGTPEYEAFRNCVQWIGTYFVQHGILSIKEMEHVWLQVEAVERA